MGNAGQGRVTQAGKNGGHAEPLGESPPAVRNIQAPVLPRFVRAQALNTQRHVAALRPFKRHEFGEGPASPSEAHIQAANNMILNLHRLLAGASGRVKQTARVSRESPTGGNLLGLLKAKENAGNWVKYVEKVWDFFFELFGQRQSRFANWLLANDRIAQDCYQVAYTGLGKAKSIPTPPPLSFMATGFTPSTYRRGVSLSRLGDLEIPFPIVQLPYHRLVNPWTLGATHHEVSHNLQSDLGLWGVVPRRIRSRLLQAGMEPQVAKTWARWHKETWADLCGLLLGGPAVVASLIDVVGGDPRGTLAYNPAGVHPTPYLRTPISLELLRRMGFEREAEAYRRLWARLYPSPRASNIPPAMLESHLEANRIVVDTICYQPYPQLGGKSLAEVINFQPSHQEMIQEAAGRLASGTDPGIIPARYLIGAARWALDHNLASPERITSNFYQALTER